MTRCERVTLLALPLAMILTTACSRQPNVLASNKAANARQLPFDRVVSDQGISPTAKLGPKQIPLGTPIVVHLRSSLSSMQVHTGDLFEAVLAEPIVVDSHTLAPGGSAVTGRVLAAKAASSSDGPGYLQLTLSSIVINGASVPIQTSSLFAKGWPHGRSHADPNTSHADAKFSTSRRLMFRFEQPAAPVEGAHS